MSKLQEKNWAGNITYTAEAWQEPQSTEDVQAIVRNSRVVKAIGSRHSFNTIADCDDTIISLHKMNQVIQLDTENHTVTVQGAMKYGDLSVYLHDNGYALPNLASLPHISVVGAIMTGTHGSGETCGNLSTSVCALEMVTGAGDVVRVSRAEHGDKFDGMVVSIGALGIITQITLDIVPTFDARQDIYLDVPLAQVYANFDAIEASAYSVSLFTRWENDVIMQAWVKSKADTEFTLGDTFYGGVRATHQCSPVGDELREHCTQQLGEVGAWHERLPHFRMEFTPSHGEEIQAEYFIPREHAVEAIQAINTLGDVITPLLYVSEIRTMTGDNLWLSPAYGRETVALHFTWKPMWEEIQQVLPQIEAVLEPFEVRPHWGKVYTMPADTIISRYERFDDFLALVKEYDPHGKFQNDFLKAYLSDA